MESVDHENNDTYVQAGGFPAPEPATEDLWDKMDPLFSRMSMEMDTIAQEYQRRRPGEEIPELSRSDVRATFNLSEIAPPMPDEVKDQIISVELAPDPAGIPDPAVIPDPSDPPPTRLTKRKLEDIKRLVRFLLPEVDPSGERRYLYSLLKTFLKSYKISNTLGNKIRGKDWDKELIAELEKTVELSEGVILKLLVRIKESYERSDEEQYMLDVFELEEKLKKL